MLSEFTKGRKISTREKKPSVIEYMGLKKEFVALEKEAHVWKNKVHFLKHLKFLNLRSIKIHKSYLPIV